MRRAVGKETTDNRARGQEDVTLKTEEFTEHFQVQADRFTLRAGHAAYRRQGAPATTRSPCGIAATWGSAAPAAWSSTASRAWPVRRTCSPWGPTRSTSGPMEGHPPCEDLVADFDEFFAEAQERQALDRPQGSWRRSSGGERVPPDPQPGGLLPGFRALHRVRPVRGRLPREQHQPALHRPAGPVPGVPLQQRFAGRGRTASGWTRWTHMDGVWGCEYAGACSEVCPKGVDPALTIQLTKLALMRLRLTGKTNRDKRAK